MTIIAISLIGTISVKASTTEQWATKQVKIYTCHDDSCEWSNNYTANHTFSGSDLTYPVHAIEWRVKATNGLSIENSYTFSFGYKPTPDSLHPNTYFMRRNAQSSKETITCQTSTDSNGYYMYKCTFTPNEDYSNSEWLYIQIQFYDSYITNLDTKITAFEERQGTNSIITQQTNEIIQQNEENTQNIINNINEANTNLINAITEQNKTCKTTVINKNTDGNQKGALANNCNATGSTSSLITKTFKIEEGTTITGLRTLAYYCFYDENMTAIGTRTQTSASQITIPNGAKFIRFQVQNNVYDYASIYQCMSNTDAILDQDHTYNKEDISDKVNNEHNKQQEILENIDDSYIESQEWEEIGNILNSSRGEWLMQKLNTTGQMHQKVFLMLTTVLALGIIKMILGR